MRTVSQQLMSLRVLYHDNGYATPLSESNNALHFSTTPLRTDKYSPYATTLFPQCFKDRMDAIELFVCHVSITVVAPRMHADRPSWHPSCLAHRCGFPAPA